MNVYHYCDINTLMAIARNHTLRLSDITKSNDSAEIIWCTQFMQNIFMQEYDKESSKRFKNKISRDIFFQRVNHYLLGFWGEGRRYSYFVICFSEARDLLSQWRGYADDGNGVAIGFDKDKLISEINKNCSELQLGNVLYQKKRQQSSIKKVAQQLIKELKILADKYEGDELLQMILGPFNREFFKLFQESVFMKNDFFKEEKEWRICFCTEIQAEDKDNNMMAQEEKVLSKVGYLNRNGNLVPYSDLKFKDNMIKEVILGPKCKTEIKEMKRFLQLNGINCKVVKSAGTYQ